MIGFMGSGKSTAARGLGRALGWEVVDLDAALAAIAGPVPDQIARDGIAAFRERERRAALALCDGRARILATGGGTVLDPEVRGALLSAYDVVWIDVPLVVAAARVGAAGDRPLWDADVERRFAERAPIYALAPHRVDGSADPDAVVDAIRAAVGR